MDLIDIPVGTEIGIEVTYKGTSLRRVTTIEINRNNILLCEPILDYENKQLDLGFSQHRCNVRVVMEDKEAMIFTGVVIRTCVWQGEEYIVLSNARLSPKSNRREAYRQYLGLRGSSVLNGTEDFKNISIRDISVIGVAFIYTNISNEKLYSVDDEVNVKFTDESINCEIDLCVKIIRLSEYDDERILYGGQILTTNCNLGNYVAIKQAQELNRV